MKIKLYLCGPIKRGVDPSGRTRNQYSRHSLGLGFLQSNCNTEVEVVIDPIDLKNADIIGLSCDVWSVKQAQKIREQFPNSKVVVGGYAAVLPEICDYGFDHVVFGEGEQALNDIINGVGDKFIQAKKIENLDLLKFPTRPFFDNSLRIVSSRGCPFKCAFCSSSHWWGNYRLHSAEWVIDDIEQALDKHPYKYVRTLDDLFIFDQKRLEKLEELWLKKGFHKKVQLDSVSIRPKFFGQTQAEILKHMRTARLRIGIETLNPEMQKKLNKFGSADDYQEIVDLAFSNNMLVTVYFIYGIPGETYDHLKPSIEFAKKNKRKINARWSKYVSLPGTPMWDGKPVCSDKFIDVNAIPPLNFGYNLST